ncbi:MAG: hypothetical protein U0996_02235 [Planctomycetaceae bacterium]
MTAEQGQPSPPRRRRRLVKWIAALLVGYVLVELVSLGVLYCVMPQASFEVLRMDREEVAKGASDPATSTEVIHPYLGWVHNPQLAVPEYVADREIGVNQLGFKDDNPGLFKRGPDTFILGIAGGSLAWQISWEAEELIRNRLKEHPKLAGKTIRIVRMALPGYKQPQQLMAYNYFLALGGEFDAVINVDGFVDGVLSITDNAAMGTSLAYPRSWHARSIAMSDPRVSDDSYEVLRLKAQRQQLAKNAESSMFAWSPVYTLTWFLRDQSAKAELIDLGIRLSKSNDDSYLHHGPPEPKPGGPEEEAEAARLWAQCSMQMHQLSKGFNTIYMHVLPPNQYLEGSKKLHAREQAYCIADHEPYAKVARSSYPKLVEAGKDLANRGVRFLDQSRAFQEYEEPLFIDPLCHFNEEGSEILADNILKELSAAIDQQSNVAARSTASTH